MSGDLTGLCLYIYLLSSFLSLSSIHIFFELSLFFLASYELQIEPCPKRARSARQWSFAGGRSCFVSKFLPRVSIVMRWRDWVGSGVRSCVLPKECGAFFPKTTASWLFSTLFGLAVLVLLNIQPNQAKKDRNTQKEGWKGGGVATMCHHICHGKIPKVVKGC